MLAGGSLLETELGKDVFVLGLLVGDGGDGVTRTSSACDNVAALVLRKIFRISEGGGALAARGGDGGGVLAN